MSNTVPPSGKATVDALADEWGKLFAVYMEKNKHDHIVITVQDLESIGTDGEMRKCLVVQELKDGLHIHLKTPEEAMKMARQNKTGFGKS